MKSLAAAIALAVVSPAFAADSSHPFDVHDLVMMDRVSDPALSPDGKLVAFQVRETDYDANKGSNGIWMVPAGGGKTVRLTDKTLNATTPRWAPDGSVYFLAPKDGVSQLWHVGANGGAAQAATSLPLDVNNFKFSPDGRHVLLSMDVFTDCADLACTKKRLDARKADKASGVVYDKVFIRHWDTWADGRRSQLFIADAGADGKIGEPRLLSKGIDGDVPSKPFGDDTEYAFSPDGATVYFDARIAGMTEPWSTNFDIYSVPADGSTAPKNLTADNPAWDGYPLPSANGKTLYYLAMKRAGFEADRYGIWAIDLVERQQARNRRGVGSLGIDAEGIGGRQDAFHGDRRQRRSRAVRHRCRDRQGEQARRAGKRHGIRCRPQGHGRGASGLETADRSLCGRCTRPQPQADHAISMPSA